MSDDLIERLRSCPFCGARGPEVRILLPTCTEDSAYDPADRAFPITRCFGCGAEVPGEDWDQTGKSAITAWNTRSSVPLPESVREALEPFARAADAFDYWTPEAMPEFSYPVQGINTTLAAEDCPNAVGQLSYHDFRRARKVLTLIQSSAPAKANAGEGEGNG